MLYHTNNTHGAIVNCICKPQGAEAGEDACRQRTQLVATYVKAAAGMRETHGQTHTLRHRSNSVCARASVCEYYRMNGSVNR